MIESFLETFLAQLINSTLNLCIRILISFIIFFVGIKIIKSIMKIIKRILDKIDADVSIEQFISTFIKAALYTILIFLIASYCGVDAASILALLGSAGVAIGLAVQGSLSNVAGGVLILLLKPFKLGDYIIDSSGNEGIVDEIHMIYTKLHTTDNKIIILPNGTLANNCITNLSTSRTRRCDLIIGISYESDIKLAKETIYKVISEDEKTLKDSVLLVYVESLGDSSINIGVRCWFNNEDFWSGKWRITENIKYALDEANIMIPYPQMDVHIDSNISK